MIGPTCRLLAVTLLLSTPPALAEVYKWVDEEGVTHYSQQPPPEGTREHSVLEPALTAPTPTNGPSTEADGGDDAAEDGAGDEEADDGPGTMAEFCDELADRRETLESEGPIRVQDEEGNLSKLGDEERAQRLERIRGQQQEHCQDGAGEA